MVRRISDVFSCVLGHYDLRLRPNVLILGSTFHHGILLPAQIEIETHQMQKSTTKTHLNFQTLQFGLVFVKIPSSWSSSITLVQTAADVVIWVCLDFGVHHLSPWKWFLWLFGFSFNIYRFVSDLLSFLVSVTHGMIPNSTVTTLQTATLTDDD